ncbi:MAG: SdpI family protein [Oscillospiraceae bacterium]|jgi:uncharacterized membrane protein|nr:SdpI family protein [Oscillospiraceae bacterium]
MKKVLWFCIAMFVFQMIIAACLYPTLPEIIPHHWGLDGEANEFGGRWTIFLVPMILSPFAMLIVYLMQREIRRDAPPHYSPKVYIGTAIVCQILFVCLFASTVLKIKGSAASLDGAVLAILGALLVVIGILMPKMKQNRVMGVRTPWTLKNEVVWQKSQHFGGVLMVTAGVFMMLSLLLPSPWDLALPLGYLMLCGVVITGHSYVVYRKEMAKKG